MKNEQKTVLVVDGGGRGSVLVWKYLESPHVSTVLATPGNDLMKEMGKKSVMTFPDVKTTDVPKIIEICKKYKVDLVDVNQDDAIAVGLVDHLEKKGFLVFGPTQAASQIEWDKAWARNFMKKFKIPHPSFKVCYSQKEGIGFVKSQPDGEWFIKASGLAAGKGALYAKDRKQATEQIREMKRFGKSGKIFLIEECLHGEEFSSFALVNGKKFVIIGHAQDHKTVYDGDQGPNTGGMGCSSTPMVITPKIEKQIKLIIKKTVEGLHKVNRPYAGILYLGGMIDKKGKVYVIEFNARLGDPEAEVIIPPITNDMYQLVASTLKGKLPKIRKDKFYRVVVTVAAQGYPVDYSQALGKQIFGLENLLKDKTVKVFGAAAKKVGQKFVIGGTRNLHVMSWGKDVVQARQKVYNALSKISAEGNNLHYRTDIGYRDLQRLTK